MIEKFIAEMRRLNFSSRTLSSYGSILAALQNSLGNKCASQANAQDIRNYLASVGNVSAATRCVKIAAIRSFAKFLRRQQADDFEIIRATKGLRGPRLQQRLPRAVSRADMGDVMEHIARLSNFLPAWQSARRHAAIALMYGAGLRSAELLSLDAAATDAEVIRIMGKGQRERIVPLLPAVREAVAQYKTAAGIKAGKLFDGLSDRDLRREIQALREEMGLPSSVTPHAFRHSFATHIYQSGGCLMALKDLMGHKSVSTTAIYTKVDENHLANVLRGAYGSRY